MSGWLLAATLAIATLAFLLLAASQQQNWSLLRLSSGPRPPGGLRPAGWLLLGLSPAAAILRDGAGFGVLLWAMLLPLAASLVAGLIALRR